MLSFSCIYVVSVRRGILFLVVLGIGCNILLWLSLGLPYNYFDLWTKYLIWNSRFVDIGLLEQI